MADDQPIKEDVKTFSHAATRTDDIGTVRIAALEKKVEEQKVKTGAQAKESQQKFTMINSVMIAILVAVASGFILVALDYWKYNEERYEKFMDKREELKTTFLSKEDVKPFLEQHNRNVNILNCFKDKGYFSIKCFE